ncbi:MAG: DUF3556 domain-containing protein [Deltaproteobacteria bacterium]|nr:DUF3556 domain-containing protein [Deltaproteobacteria bacterium]MBP7290451.1 DUF3556 domain-containing protein [Nannocystaceae bacterium]
MGLLDPTPPPYDPLEWITKPLAERGRMVCQSWAMQGYGTPLAVYLVYAIKLAAYVGAWVWFCGFSPELGGATDIARWWLSPIAFVKAITWSMVFELLGLGCGSGPLTGRYFPPVGGFLYFLRPGTTKLPLFERAPLLGGSRRTIVDVLLYAATIALSLRVLVTEVPGPTELLPVVIAVVVMGVADRTLFLAARGEHYWTTLICFTFAAEPIAGAKAVALALWFWAGVSKIGPHFPAVVAVMTSNSPFTRWAWLRRRMYRSYPDDLRPSRLAGIMAHAGASLEFGVPIVLASSPGGASLVVGIALMLMLHGYITSNVPMGVPIEWNAMVVYGGFALFWAHPGVTAFAVGSDPASLAVGALLVVMLVLVPLVGNLWPHAVSFLLAMRYYAGNWAYGVWLFRGDSHTKLERLTKSAPWIYAQLDRMYDRRTSVGLVGKVLGFRMMHLHGRALPLLIPRAVERYEDYEHVDGELVAGLVLGWNFGDGHLHHDGLLRAVQAQCGFEPGELRCVFVEAQPLFGHTQAWRIFDAATGELERGVLEVEQLRAMQPWG